MVQIILDTLFHCGAPSLCLNLLRVPAGPLLGERCNVRYAAPFEGSTSIVPFCLKLLLSLTLIVILILILDVILTLTLTPTLILLLPLTLTLTA